MPWVEHFGPNIELVLVQLPGRGSRITEVPHDNMNSCVDELVKHADFIASKPCVFFGHSLGSRIAYALSCKLFQLGYRLPRHLLASASCGPHLTNTKRSLYDLPEHAFLDALKKLDGTPPEVLENSELMELLSPLIRADFKVAELYKATSAPLNIQLTVLSGTQDSGVSREQIKAWADLSKKTR